MEQAEKQGSRSGEFLQVTEVCRQFPIGEHRMRKLIESGEIPSIRLGRRVLVRPEQVAAWLRAQETPAAR